MIIAECGYHNSQMPFSVISWRGSTRNQIVEFAGCRFYVTDPEAPGPVERVQRPARLGLADWKPMRRPTSQASA